MLLFLFFLIIQIRTKPFITKHLNVIEANEIFTLIMTIILGTIAHLSTDDQFKLILSAILIILNIQFLLFALRMIAIYKYHNLINNKYLKCLDRLIFLKNIAGI